MMHPVKMPPARDLFAAYVPILIIVAAAGHLVCSGNVELPLSPPLRLA